jgi:peptidoglycan hydrolase CwlO-like protein
MKIFKKIAVLVLTIVIICLVPQVIAEDDASDKLQELQKKIREYESKVEELRGQKQTLAAAISYLDNQIELTTYQIYVTEQELLVLAKEINGLSVKIHILENTIENVSAVLNSRIQATYKRDTIKPFYLFFSIDKFSDIFNRIKYLKVAQANDKRLLYDMQESQINFDKQKDLKEAKQAQEQALKKQLVAQKATLDQQKAAKQELLQVTENDEKKFQQLLAAARAEMEALQSILAGQGNETKVGEVSEGETIASIIVGASACSTGTHLHFEVAKNNAHVNPAGFLKSIGVDWDLCGWYGCDEPFSFSGSWNWPMNEPIRITQGYGMTAYARSGAYGGGSHTGIDMVSDNRSVKTVENGTLYRGSIACGGGTLRYVKVDHKDSDTDTYYVHVNYVK